MSDLEKQTTLLNLELRREKVRNEIEALKNQRKQAYQQEIEKEEAKRKAQIEWEKEQEQKVIQEQQKLRELDIKFEQLRQEKLLNEYKKDPRVFYGDLASELAVRRYYEKLYQRIKDGMEGYQDFTVKSERNTLFSMLGNNDRYYGEQSRFYGKYQCNQAFKLAGKLFHVFDDDTEEAVVPYGKGKELIAELKALSFAPSADFLAKFIEKIKPYTVSLYDYQKEKLGNCLACVGGIWILEPQAYDDAVGLISTEIKAKFLEA